MIYYQALKYAVFRGSTERNLANVVGAGLAREAAAIRSHARRRSYAGYFGATSIIADERMNPARFAVSA